MTEDGTARGADGQNDRSKPVRSTAILGLGSNIGDKRANVQSAMALLVADGHLALIARSRDWRTPPWGVTDQDWFVNACIAVDTALSPRALLERCLEVERQLARVRTRHWGPRTIDVDILFYGDERISELDLVIPHPRITERACVLGPLSDIAADLVLDGRTVAERLAAIDRSGVHPLD